MIVAKRVQYSQPGGPEVLELVDYEPSVPQAGQIQVQVRFAGLNPIDWKIRSRYRGLYDGPLPSGNGADFSGVVVAVGEGVTQPQVGDLVFGGAFRQAQAELLTVPADSVALIPEGLDEAIAGGLDIVGRTAWNSVESLGLTADDTVLVSAAAGGVGVLAVQFAKRTGARVIATASERNHDFLRELGAEPVSYGDGLVDRLREIAPAGITAVLDTHGADTIHAALELGVAPERINTIAAPDLAKELGLGNVGGTKPDAAKIHMIGALIAAGEVVLPIEAIYPFAAVQDAYRHQETGRARGKILLAVDEVAQQRVTER